MTHEAFSERSVSFARLRSRTLRNAPQRLEVAVDAMRQNPAEMHTLARLAKLVGMSRSNFAESFRLNFGRTPMEFLRSMRLDHAALLLRSGSLPVKLIGANVGYDSRTSFTNAFRRVFDLSPAEYRTSHTKLPSTDIHAVSQRLRARRGKSQDLAWEIDLSNGTVWWSEGTFAALGYKKAKRLASDVARFYERIHPNDRVRVVESASVACSGERLTWDSEFQFKKANGTYVTISNGCVILRDSDGAALILFGVMRILRAPPLDDRSIACPLDGEAERLLVT